jgi:hypothetical protein
LLLTLLVIALFAAKSELDRRTPQPRRPREDGSATLPENVENVGSQPWLARWLGAACCRFWRTFYYWTVDELDGPADSTACGFYLSEVPQGWYAYRVRTERSQNGPIWPSVILLPRHPTERT